MHSLSSFAEALLKTSTPMISDIEVGLNLSETYSRELSNFINRTFTTHEFEFNNNGIVRSVKLFNEDSRRYVDIVINESANLLNSSKHFTVTEYVNDVIKFSTDVEYTSLNELKDSLSMITKEYKCKNEDLER